MQPGDRIGERFVVERAIAKGGMGKVYRGLDRERNVAVAIKLLRPATVEGAAGVRAIDVRRFGREAELLAALSHPGIVAYVAHGQTPVGQLYLVQEWLDGVTLADQLDSCGLDVRESVAVARQIADALAAVHAVGVVHRDIKPANLFLVGGQCDAVKILDFGIARPQDDALRVTSTGAILGSVGYMAPEQARGSRHITVAADVFALGCVLYECLAGVGAFPGQNSMAIRAKILLSQPVSLMQRCPELPASLCQLVTRMLAKEPEQRPAGGAEVARALAAIADLPVTPRRPLSGDSPITAVALDSPPDTAASELARAPDYPSEFADDAVCLVLATVDPDGLQSPLPTAAELRDLAGLARGGDGLGGWLDRIEDHSLVLRFAGPGSATECARRAARAALAIQRRLPRATVVIATGTETQPSAIDRGAALLEASDRRALFGQSGRRIALDALTARLVADEFALEHDDGGWYLPVEP